MEARLGSRQERFSMLRVMLYAPLSDIREVIRYYRDRFAAQLSGTDVSVANELEKELRRMNIPGPRRLTPSDDSFN